MSKQAFTGAGAGLCKSTQYARTTISIQLELYENLNQNAVSELGFSPHEMQHNVLTERYGS